MTITAGNSNNGIPMGGYVPGTGSGGGGVSGDVYRYKGSVPTYTALPAENLETGDVYNVIDTDMNYAWTGTAWDPLGSTVDLSPYYTGAQVEAKLLQKQDAITFGQGLSYAKIVSQISCIVDNGDGTYKGLLSDTNAAIIPHTVIGTNLYCNIPTTERGNQVLDGSRVLFYTGSVVGKVIKQGPSWTPSDDTKDDGTLTQKSIMLGNINSENKFTPKFIFWTGYNGATTPEYAYHRISRINSTIASGADPYASTWDCFATEYSVSDTTLLLNHTSTASSANVGLNNRPFKITLGTSTEGNLTARVEYPSNSYTTPNPIDLGITVEEANELNCVVFSVPYYRVGYPYHTNFADTGIFDGDSQIWTPTPQSTSQLSNLSVNYDNSTITLNDDGQLTASYELPTASTDTLGGVKVDGTSIVIADGVISTNAGTGVDTYTKGEVDILLAKKEDNIAALSPLTLEQKTSSTGSVGFTVSESNTLMPSSDAISLSYDINSSSTIASEFNNYIVIPYSYQEKTVVRFPCNNNLTSTNDYTTSAFLGYLEGTTVQPLVYVPISSNTNNAHTRYAYTTNVDNPEATIGVHNNNTAGSYNADGLIEGKTYSYLTTYYSPQWTQYALTSYSKNGESGGKDIICFQRYNFDTTEEKSAIEKANCVVISYGVSLNQFPIDLTLCGKFPYKGDYATGAAIPYDAPLDDVADLTNNILDFTTVTVNELSLNIDNSTIKVNDSGQLYAASGGGETYTLPAATSTTLGGVKIGSNLAVTDDGTLSATYIPATTVSLGVVKPDGTTITVDEDGTIHSTQEGFADLAANNVFTGTNQFQSTVTVGNGFNTAVLNMGPGSGLIFENSSQAGGKKLSLGTQTGTQVTIYSDGVPIIQRSETRTNQSSSDDNPYTKYDNVDSGNIAAVLGETTLVGGIRLSDDNWNKGIFIGDNSTPSIYGYNGSLTISHLSGLSMTGNLNIERKDVTMSVGDWEADTFFTLRLSTYDNTTAYHNILQAKAQDKKIILGHEGYSIVDASDNALLTTANYAAIAGMCMPKISAKQDLELPASGSYIGSIPDDAGFIAFSASATSTLANATISVYSADDVPGYDISHPVVTTNGAAMCLWAHKPKGAKVTITYSNIQFNYMRYFPLDI